MPDATADQGAEERPLDALVVYVSLGCFDRHVYDAGGYCQGHEKTPELIAMLDKARAALPLQASCVGLMEELESELVMLFKAVEADDPKPEIRLRVVDLLTAVRVALKAAQEKPSAG